MDNIALVRLVIDQTNGIVDSLESALAQAQGLAASALSTSIGLPDEQRDHLMGEAKLLADNVSSQVAVYSIFGDWVRALDRQAQGPELRESYLALRRRVFGD